MIWEVATAILLLLVVMVIVSITTKYNSLFSPQNICQLAEGMVQIKRAALNSIIQPGEEYSPEKFEPNTFIAPSGLAVMYTISKRDALFLHHISLSMRSGSMAHSAAATIASWISFILNVPPERIRIPIDLTAHPGAVWHVTFELTSDEETLFASESVKTFTPDLVTKQLWQQIAPSREIILRASIPKRVSESQ